MNFTNVKAITFRKVKKTARKAGFTGITLTKGNSNFTKSAKILVGSIFVKFEICPELGAIKVIPSTRNIEDTFSVATSFSSRVLSEDMPSGKYLFSYQTADGFVFLHESTTLSKID